MMKRQSEEVESVEDAEQPLVKSKTQRKKEMIELQELGKRLVDLTKSQLAAIDLPQELLDALKLAKQLKRGEALRRQTQHIGALMRSVDPEPIRLLVENIDHIHQKSVDKFHQLEIYRDQLLNADPDVFGELSIKFPQLDRQHLMQLVRNAIKEKERNKPPKSFRLIFDYLKELTKQSPA